MLTQDILKELLHYDPETGIFTWKERDRKWFESDRQFKTWNIRFSGKIAGCKRKLDCMYYIVIGVLGKNYMAHRLACMYMTGSFPQYGADHIDHDGLNNKWSNLRDVNVIENNRNRSINRNNKSGITGVHFNKEAGKFKACIRNGLRTVFLGNFATIEEAASARRQAEIKYNYHHNHGILKGNHGHT